MNLQKLISELQERNREKLLKIRTTDERHLELSDQLTTDSFNAGALAVIEEAKKPFESIIKNSEYSKPHSAEDKAALKCTQVFLNHLSTLEAKIKDV